MIKPFSTFLQTTMRTPCLAFVFCMVCSSAAAQTTGGLLTSAYGGFYALGKKVEKGRIGAVIVYPESDSTILFYMDLNRGAPSYNMGSLYGRVKINNGSGVFYTNFGYSENGCKLGFQFIKKELQVTYLDQQFDCGFGFAVDANGDYKKKSDDVPEYFEEMEGTKIYFKQTDPDGYYKD